MTSSGHNKLLIFIFENCTTVSWDKVAAKSVIFKHFYDLKEATLNVHLSHVRLSYFLSFLDA